MATDTIAVALCDRYTSKFEADSSMRWQWQEIADYYLPHKSNILRERPQGQENRDHLFTGVGTRAGKRLASNLHASLTSQAVPWFVWRDEVEELNNNRNVGAWYQACTAVAYNAFHGPLSNFNSQQHEFFIDLVFFHTACKYFEIVTYPNGAFKHFAFKTIQIGTYTIDEDVYGRVDTVFRRFDMTVRNAVAKFGIENLPDEIRKWDQKKPDKKFPFLHIVLPARDYRIIGGNSDLPVSSIFISLTGKKRVKEEGYKTMPYIVARWDKTSGDVWGFGPAADALPDLKSFNKNRELKLDAGGMAVRPPMRVDDDGVVGDIDLTPGGYTTVRPNAKFEPIFMGSDLKVAELTEDTLRTEIQDSFFYDDLRLPAGGRMTAEEVIQRIEILQRLLGPETGRIESEDLNPTTSRAWQGLKDAGAFPPLPIEFKDRQPAVRYEGPLARAQRGVIIEAILKTRTIAERIAATTGPDVMDYFDEDKELVIVGKVLGYPDEARRGDRQIKERRTARREQEQLAAMPTQAKDLGAGAKSFADAFSAIPQNGTVPGPVGVAGA